MIASDGNDAGIGNCSLAKNHEFRRTCADVSEAHSQIALVGAQHGVGACEWLEHCVIDVHTGAIDGRHNILRGARSGGHHVDADFQAGGHHAQRIVHARLLVENEFLRQQMENFPVGGQGNGARFVDRHADFFAGDLARAISEGDATMRVDAAHVRAGHTDQRMLHGSARPVFGTLHRFLNRGDRLLQIYNHTLARTARLGNPVAAIAQTVLRDFRHQRTGFCAPHINDVQKVPVLVRHPMDDPVDPEFLRSPHSACSWRAHAERLLPCPPASRSNSRPRSLPAADR